MKNVVATSGYVTFIKTNIFVSSAFNKLLDPKYQSMYLEFYLGPLIIKNDAWESN